MKVNNSVSSCYLRCFHDTALDNSDLPFGENMLTKLLISRLGRSNDTSNSLVVLIQACILSRIWLV